MIRIVSDGQLYVDVRAYERPEALSYDLSRHLPRRMSVGPVVVVANNPPVFLSVVRKRLAKLLCEIERQRARTLDRKKRDGLAHEIQLLKTYRFTTKLSLARPDALFIAPDHLDGTIPRYTTLYLTSAVLTLQLQQALTRIGPGGLLVVYGQWPHMYEQALAEHLAMV